MKWKVKCLAFYALQLLPRTAYSAIQKHITNTYHLTLCDEVIESYRFHVKNYRGGTALELGAGANLLAPLLLKAHGCPRIYALDLSPLATVDRVNHVISQLRERLPGKWPAVMNLGADLLNKYGIDYRAPSDARETGLPSGSIDFIYTTSVLEHIPVSDLRRILTECARIGSDRLVMSHNIGYIDHYAHADKSISYFHFYKYPDWLWRLFNPSMQYQNRLRHSDFVRLFTESGFLIDMSDRLMSTDEERAPAVPIHPRFIHYSSDDLFAHNGLFVLRRGSGQVRAGK